MNRQEFMRQLELLLSGIPASEREDALAYYNNYFDEAGVENEAQVIAELGSPEAVAKNIIADVQQEGTGYSNPEPQAHENQVVLKKTIGSRWKGMNQSTKILLILLLVFTFPLWIGIVAGIFGYSRFMHGNLKIDRELVSDENLNLLADLGEAIKITTPNGGVHFDGRTEPHYHFCCNNCGEVIDLNLEELQFINEAASENFKGVIESHSMMFYGTCENCIKSN